MHTKAILCPAKFNWADEVEEQVEALCSQSGKAYAAPSIVTSSTSSEASSYTGNTSPPDTPVTSFSLGSSPIFPSVDVADVHRSRLVISLDIAGQATDVDKLVQNSELEWLNLIEPAEECGLYHETNSQHSGLTITLDLAIPRDLEVTFDQSIQSRASTTSELLCLHQTPVTDGVNTGTEDENPAQGDEAADGKESKEVGETVEVETGSRYEVTLAVEKTTSTSNKNSALGDIDLDTVFGGAADDLFEDYEAKNRAARTSINTCAHHSIAGAADASGEVELSSNTSMVLFNTPHSSSNHSEPSPTDASLQLSTPVKAEDVADWFVSKWEKICAATQRAKLEGHYQHKSLQVADRSVDWMWESTNGDNRHQYDPRIFSAAAVSAGNHGEKSNITPEQKCIHHLNYLQQPIFTKSDTPPEVSLWAVRSGHANGHHPSFSRQGVLSSQAWKFIDPFSYSGPLELLNYKGTKLRDEVTGYVDKVYHPIGSWELDQYSSDEIIPRVVEGQEYTDFYNAPPQQSQEIRRSADGTVPFCSDEADPEDAAVNDDGRSHINKPKSDKGRIPPPPSRLATTQVSLKEISDLKVVSPVLKQIDPSRFAEDQSMANNLDSILPEQSDEDLVAEDEEFYTNVTVTVAPNLPQAEEVNPIPNGAALTNSPDFARAEDGEQMSNELVDIDSPKLPETEKTEPISDEPSVTDSSNVAEGEEGGQSSAEESDGSSASTASTAQALRDLFESPDFILTERHVQAIMDGNEAEASAIMAQRNELRASMAAPATNDTHVVSDDEEQTDYTDTWVRRNVRSVSNQDYLSRWSESAAVAAHDEDGIECCTSSPANTNATSPTRSWSIDDDATPEDKELERLEDESAKVMAQLREVDRLNTPSPQGQRQCDIDKDMDVSEAREVGEEKSQVRLMMGSSSNQDFYADVLDLIQENDILLARDGVGANLANHEDSKSLEPHANLTGDDISTSRGYTRPVTVEEEEELLDRGHVAAMMEQEQADAQAEVLLDAYLGYLKHYHRKSWEVASHKVCSIEATVTEDHACSEHKEINAGQSDLISTPSPLLDPNPAVVLVQDSETILYKSYQHTSSPLPTVAEGKGENGEDKTVSASDLDSSPCGKSPLDEQRKCTNVDLSNYEECSEDMEDGLVWDEDSESMVERAERDGEDVHESSDTEECEVDVVSVRSDELANMNTQTLDSLLSNVSGLLANCPASENAGQDSLSDLNTVRSVAGEEKDELIKDTLEEEQLAEEKEQLAEEARKLAGREKEVVEREEKLAEAEKLLAQKEKDLVEEAKILAEEKAQLAREKELAEKEVEKAEEGTVDHAFDTIACPSDIPPAMPTFNEHFFGSFAIAVGGKASKLAMGLSGVLRSSANVLHRG